MFREIELVAMPVDSRESEEFGGQQLGSFEEVFSTLGDETRIEILLELSNVASEDGIGSGLTFSTLRKRIGVADSGRFNYHLNELTGQFVAKRGDTYVARWPGLMLIAAIHAGLYDDADTPKSDSAVTNFTCPKCLDPLEVQFTEGDLGTGVYLYCEDHSEMTKYWYPPGAQQGRSLSDLIRIAATRLLTNVRLARQGICMECWGRVSTDVSGELPDRAADEELSPDEDVIVAFQCERCWNQPYVPLRTSVATHPIVASAFERRGYEPVEAAYAQATRSEVTCEERLVNDGSAEASVRIGFDHETLTVWVDEECSVIEHQWN